MKALIVQNAYIKNQSQLYQSGRIAEELTCLGVEAEVLKNFSLAVIKSGKIRAGNYDFCVFLDKDRVAARLLEGAGLRLFNPSATIEVCDDKMLTNIALTRAGIPVPDSVYAPLCYYKGERPNADFLRGTVQKLGLPLVAKINYGSLGAGVSLIKTQKQLADFESKNMLTPHFYQKFVGEGGRDIRVIVIGGKTLCAMQRSNKGDFRSNIELGGIGEGVQPDEALRAIAEGAAAAVNADYCGVDILKGEGGYLVCEVNSNAFFTAAERVCSVNIAKAYAEYILYALSTK